MYEVISQELITLIEKIDLAETRLGKLFRSISGAMADIAAVLYIGQIEIDYTLYSTVYSMKSKPERRVRVYNRNLNDKQEPLVRKYKNKGKETVVTLYCVADHEWAEDEINSIRGVIDLIFISFSRASLLGMLAKSDTTDAITGLLNHTGLVRSGNHGAIRRVISYYAGCTFNIKGFKRINSNIGVNKANQLLQEYGQYVYDFLDSDTELVGRLSGDDFFALVMRERLPEFLKYVQDGKGKVEGSDGRLQTIEFDVRVGIYEAKPSDSMEIILNNSMAALEYGRLRNLEVSYFSAEISNQGIMEKKIIDDFPKAMANGDIIAYYQPKVNLETMELCGCESLVRWFQDGKMISPGQFLPALEKHHAMYQLDYYMLETVCYDIQSWLDRGIEPVRISVNYSKQHIADPDLAKNTIDIVKKHNVDPKYVEIELTETAEYADNEAMQRFVQELSEYGIKVSMDDFGTGYSSLNLLLNLDFGVVKIDKSFVDNVGTTDQKELKDAIMIRNMVNMLHELDMEVVAEGVETIEQLNWIKGIHCDVVQGYIFDKPLPHSEFEKRLIRRKYEMKES